MEPRVGAWGESLKAEARLYGELTGRPSCIVRPGDSLADIDVLLVLEQDLSPTLMNALYDDPDRIRAPGLLYAADPEAMDQQVRLRAAAARTELEEPVSVRHLLPTSSLGVDETGELIGAEAPPSTVREALRNGGLLSIQSHSDGVDTLLHPDLVLCPRFPAAETEPAENGPLCIDSHHCHRTGRPVVDAERGGFLFSARELRARALIYDVCNGLLLPGGPLAPRHSMLTRLLREAELGWVITTWEAVLVTPQFPVRMARMLAEGLTAGEAVARHNRSELARWFGHRYCLIGDPLSRLPVREALVPDERPPRGAPENGDLSEVGRCISWSRRWSSRPSEVKELEESLGRWDDLGPRQRRRTQQRVMASRSPSSSLARFWFPEQVAEPSSIVEACRRCGRSARTARIETVAGTRRVQTCAICLHVFDLPEGMDPRLSCDEPGRLHLSVPDGPGDWSALVYLWSPDAEMRRARRWPRDSRGRLAPELRWPEPWRRGYYKVLVHVMWDLREGLLGAYLRTP